MGRSLTRLAVWAGVAGSVVAAAMLVGTGAAADPAPAVVKARPGTQCVDDPAIMRREHMDRLKHQRDVTVHQGVRGGGKSASLNACIECHASPQTRSVAASSGDFCVSCHQYTAVRLDCFECHNPKTSVSLAQALLPGALNEAASRDFRTAVSQDEVHMASLALTSATTAHGVAARQP